MKRKISPSGSNKKTLKKTTLPSSSDPLIKKFEMVATTFKSIESDLKNLNGLQTLLSIFIEENEFDLLNVASEAIFKIFCKAIEAGIFMPRKLGSLVDQEDDSAVLFKWLNEILGKFYEHSLQLLKSEGEIEVVAFNSLMNLILLTGKGQHEEYAFPVEYLEKMVEIIIKKDPKSSQLFELFDAAINSYRDIRYYSLRAICRVCQAIRSQSPSNESLMRYHGIFKIISEIVMETDAEIEKDEAEVRPFFIEAVLPAPLSTTKAHLQQFSSSWLEFIQGVSTHAPDLHRSFLLIVNERVIPYMTNPALLSDYLTDSYNSGGLVSLLALNGLFTLIQCHNLDYPSFFLKLYSTLDGNILHCRYRKRFCRLFALFMTSTHMPAYLVAAFVKRIARLSLSAPPSVLKWSLAFIYNMFKAHPAIRVLIHRHAEVAEEYDPFVMEELDPAKCKAIESSIWEVHSFSRHYWAEAVKTSRVFTERLTKPLFKLDELLDGPTYNSLIQQELSHKWSRLPPLNIQISEKIL